MKYHLLRVKRKRSDEIPTVLIEEPCFICSQKIESEYYQCKYCHNFFHEECHRPALIDQCKFCTEIAENKCHICHKEILKSEIKVECEFCFNLAHYTCTHTYLHTLLNRDFYSNNFPGREKSEYNSIIQRLEKEKDKLREADNLQLFRTITNNKEIFRNIFTICCYCGDQKEYAVTNYQPPKKLFTINFYPFVSNIHSLTLSSDDFKKKRTWKSSEIVEKEFSKIVGVDINEYTKKMKYIIKIKNEGYIKENADFFSSYTKFPSLNKKFQLLKQYKFSTKYSFHSNSLTLCAGSDEIMKERISLKNKIAGMVKKDTNDRPKIIFSFEEENFKRYKENWKSLIHFDVIKNVNILSLNNKKKFYEKLENEVFEVKGNHNEMKPDFLFTRLDLLYELLPVISTSRINAIVIDFGAIKTPDNMKEIFKRIHGLNINAKIFLFFQATQANLWAYANELLKNFYPPDTTFIKSNNTIYKQVHIFNQNMSVIPETAAEFCKIAKEYFNWEITIENPNIRFITSTFFKEKDYHIKKRIRLPHNIFFYPTNMEDDINIHSTYNKVIQSTGTLRLSNVAEVLSSIYFSKEKCKSKYFAFYNIIQSVKYSHCYVLYDNYNSKNNFNFENNWSKVSFISAGNPEETTNFCEKIKQGDDKAIIIIFNCLYTSIERVNSNVIFDKCDVFQLYYQNTIEEDLVRAFYSHFHDQTKISKAFEDAIQSFNFKNSCIEEREYQKKNEFSLKEVLDSQIVDGVLYLNEESISLVKNGNILFSNNSDKVCSVKTLENILLVNHNLKTSKQHEIAYQGVKPKQTQEAILEKIKAMFNLFNKDQKMTKERKLEELREVLIRTGFIVKVRKDILDIIINGESSKENKKLREVIHKKVSEEYKRSLNMEMIQLYIEFLIVGLEKFIKSKINAETKKFLFFEENPDKIMEEMTKLFELHLI